LDPLEKIRIRIKRFEEREEDSWVDMGLRTIRKGRVRFYRVNDPLTGKWLFKVCSDDEIHKTIVKSLKCPSGPGFVQLEGRMMLFQKSLVEGYYYGVVSLSYIDDKERLRRRVVKTVEEIPDSIKKNFKIAEYEEVSGKQAIGNRLVTLCEESDEKKMITLFIIQRAWPIAKIPPDIGVKIFDLLGLIKNLERAEIKDLYQTAEVRYELTKEETDMLLRFLETKGKILRSEEYIKTRP
jgi:hypothetical protein